MPPRRKTTLPLGVTLGEAGYKLDRIIGNGAMGTVFEAKGEGGARLAIKTLFSTQGQSDAPERRARFLREAAVCASLQSPHVVPVLDHGIDAATDVPFLVMPFLEGADLGAIIERVGPLDPGVAAALFVQACTGVGAAHAAGIIHRDIKPTNLLVTKAGGGKVTLKVADFGLAKVTDPLNALTTSGAFMGTAQYVSPEQATNAKRADARSDIWSLAMSLYHALAGKPAFAQTGSFLALVLHITGGKVRSLQELAPWVDGRLVRVVHGALIRDPELRCPDVGELSLALDMAVGIDKSRQVLLESALSPLPEDEKAPRERVDLPDSWDDLLRM